jgi:hypothetical protein
MKLAIIAFAMFTAAETAVAQDHLIPETGVLAQDEGYHIKLTELLAETLRGDSVLQVVFLPSFQPEAVAGIRKAGNGFEAFASKPSYHIAEKIGAAELDKESTPDFRDLTVHTERRAISVPLTERIRRIWQDMLLNTRYPKSPRIGTDGMDVHFSMWVLGHGFISGQIWSPRHGKTLALVDLADALGAYAEGKLDEKKLVQFLKPFER